MSLPSVIITRPNGQEGYLLSALQQKGYSTEHFPLMDIVPVTDDARTAVLRNITQNTDQYAVILIVSSRRAEHGLRWLDAYWPLYSVRMDWTVPDPSTQALLKDVMG